MKNTCLQEPQNVKQRRHSSPFLGSHSHRRNSRSHRGNSRSYRGNSRSHRRNSRSHEERKSRRNSLLIMDDEPLHKIILRKQLSIKASQDEDSSWTDIQEASDGEEAVSLSTSGVNSPSIIIMDVEMPNTDGIEATQRIRRNSADSFLPVIIAHTTREDLKDRCLSCGMNDSIPKPCPPKLLRQKLSKWKEIVDTYQELIMIFNKCLQEIKKV